VNPYSYQLPLYVLAWGAAAIVWAVAVVFWRVAVSKDLNKNGEKK